MVRVGKNAGVRVTSAGRSRSTGFVRNFSFFAYIILARRLYRIIQIVVFGKITSTKVAYNEYIDSLRNGLSTEPLGFLGYLKVLEVVYNGLKIFVFHSGIS